MSKLVQLCNKSTILNVALSKVGYCILYLVFNFLYTTCIAEIIVKKSRGKKMGEASKCGCGRSPTGNCIGWHSLSVSEYQVKRATYEKRQAEKAKK